MTRPVLATAALSLEPSRKKEERGVVPLVPRLVEREADGEAVELLLAVADAMPDTDLTAAADGVEKIDCDAVGARVPIFVGVRLCVRLDEVDVAIADALPLFDDVGELALLPVPLRLKEPGADDAVR